METLSAEGDWLLASLQQPVAAHDAGEHEGQHFLVMEYVDGLDLSALVRAVGRASSLPSNAGTSQRQVGSLPHSAMTVADACELIRQAALGLQHAYQRGMVHRDIKPSNLMLAGVESTEFGMGHDDSGESVLPNPNSAIIKILDMGLALLDEQRTAERRDLTSTGQMMGTLDYMAPEQGMDSRVVDIRADIYSLGATNFKLPCGEASFSNDKYNTPVKMLVALGMESAPSIATKRDDLPPELVAVVDRMLAKKPEDRFASPAEVAEALAPFAEDADLAELARRASVATSPSETSEHKSRSTDPHASSALLDTTSNMPAEEKRSESVDKNVLGAGSGLGRGLPTPTPSPTEGLQEPASGRPAVGQVARSGVRATTGKPEPAGTGKHTTSAQPMRWYSNRRVRIALGTAAAALLLFAATVIIIKNREGKVVRRIRVPGEHTVEVLQDPKRSQTKPDVSPPVIAPRVGEWPIGSAENRLDGIVSNPAQLPGLGRWNVVPTLPGLGRATTFDVSPDGRYLAAANADDYVRIYDLKTGQVVGICSEFGDNNAEVIWNPTSSLVLVKTLRSGVHRMHIYEPNGTKRGEFPNRSANYERIASGTTYMRSFGYHERTPWNTDGRRLVVFGAEGAAICSFDGRVITKLEKSLPNAVEAMWSPTGELVLLTQDVLGFGKSGVWRANGEHVCSFDSEKDGRVFCWCPDGESITIITTDSVVRRVALNGESETLVEKSVEAPEKLRVRWSPNGKWLAAGGENAEGLVRLYNADGETGPTIRAFQGRSPYNMAWNPDGTRLAMLREAKLEVHSIDRPDDPIIFSTLDLE